MSSNWTKLSVRIATQSLTAERLVAQLGLVPSRNVEVGQPISPRSTALHSQAFCVYDSPLSTDVRPDEHLAWAIELLRNVADRIALIVSPLEIDIRLGFASTTGQGGVALTAPNWEPNSISICILPRRKKRVEGGSPLSR